MKPSRTILIGVHLTHPNPVAMVVRHTVDGYDEFNELIQTLEGKANAIYVLFTGSKDSQGKSWCSDCVKAVPVIEEGLQNAEEDSHFVIVSVGDRALWKDPNTKFRMDPRLKIKAVPTLIVWGKPDRIEEAECANSNLVQMIFEDNA